MSKNNKREDLRTLFEDLQKGLMGKLNLNRKHISHPGTQGDETELNWKGMLNDFLPTRYDVEKAFVIDSDGNLSEQTDIVIYDRQYSPFIFKKKSISYITAESVYAVFEVKPCLDANTIRYAGKKAASVRKLSRTSLSIPYADGVFPPKKPHEILAGILTCNCKWKSPFEKKLLDNLLEIGIYERLQLGCVLETGSFNIEFHEKTSPVLSISKANDSLIFFFVNLLYRLQQMGTVPMIDIHEYAKWLKS